METIELREYLEPLRKWWWLVVLATLLAGISSALYTMQQPPLYRSSTTVMVGNALFEPNPSGGELSLGAQLALGYVDMAQRASIREATARALGLEVLPGYLVAVVPNTQFIEISVTDSSPQRAQAVAAELANQMILQTPGGNPQAGGQSFLEEQIAQLEASIIATNEEIKRLEQELTTLFSAREIAGTRGEISALQTKVSTLQANYASLFASSRKNASNVITVIEPAELPLAPLDSGMVINTVIAGMAGFALAAVGAYVMEYLDQSLRSTHEVIRYLNLLILGAIPRIGRRELQKHGPLVAAGPHTPITDAYAALRLNVQAVLDDRPHSILLITSPTPEEGKSTIAANLAIDWARSGQKVILVDADFYHPSQQRFFSVPNQMGLTTALVDRAVTADALLRPTKVRGLSLLTSGPLLPSPASLLAQPTMRRLLASLRAMADVVIIDTPPATAAVDASILALQADGVLLVLSAGRTKRDLAKRTLDLFRQIRAPVLGVTLFNAPEEHSFYRYFKNSYRDMIRLPENERERSMINNLAWEWENASNSQDDDPQAS